MTRIFAVRAKAIEFLSGNIALVSGVWESPVWDSQKWNVLQGSAYTNRSGYLTVFQAEMSGTWDIHENWQLLSGDTVEINTPLKARWVKIRYTGASGYSPSSGQFRLGTWGALEDTRSQIQGYNYGSSEWKAVGVDLSGQIEVNVTWASDVIVAKTSGEVAKISGEVVKTSGEVSKISGEVVKISGEAVKVSGETLTVASGPWVIAKTSGEVAKISGETIVVASGPVVIAKISGDVVKVSGEVVKVSGETLVVASGPVVIAKISGDVVKVSGETLVVASGPVVIAKISGDVVKISGEVTKVSGETVVVASGPYVIAKISGDVVKISGEVAKISGETVIALTSGQTTTIASGSWVVAKVSGEVAKISGETIVVASGPVVIAKVSGDVVKVSGEVIKVSGETVVVASGFISIAKISGDVVKVSGEVVKVSGETLIAKVSGEVAKVSGETVIVASGPIVIAKTSGEVAKISGETVLALNSGQAVVAYPVLGIRHQPVLHPFAKGSLASGGIQYSTLVSGIGWSGNYTVVEAVTITNPQNHVIDEIDFGLVGGITCDNSSTSYSLLWQASDDGANWQALNTAMSASVGATSGTIADVTPIAGRFAPTGNFLGSGATFAVQMTVLTNTSGNTVKAQTKNASYVMPTYRSL